MVIDVKLPALKETGPQKNQPSGSVFNNHSLERSLSHFPDFFYI